MLAAAALWFVRTVTEPARISLDGVVSESGQHDRRDRLRTDRHKVQAVVGTQFQLADNQIRLAPKPVPCLQKVGSDGDGETRGREPRQQTGRERFGRRDDEDMRRRKTSEHR